MPDPQSTTRPDAPAGIRDRWPDLLSDAESTGRRLAAELRTVLEALGWPVHSVRSLARSLNVDASICQRVAATARCTESPLEAIQRTPGLEGLEQFRRACAKRDIDRRLLEALAAAIAQLERLMERHGGGLSRLRNALSESAPAQSLPPRSKDSLRHRRDAFLALSACTGSCLDAQAVSVFMRPGPEGSKLLEGFLINAYVGWRSRPGGLPLLLSTFGDAAAKASLAGAPGGRPAGLGPRAFIFDKYSTQPTPLVSVHSAAPGVSTHMLDPAWEPPGAKSGPGSADAPGADVVVVNTINGSSDPRCTSPRIHNSFVRCRYPARELLLDVYLTRELAAASLPAAGIYWSSKWLTDGFPALWHDRLPGPNSVLVAPAASLENPLHHCPWHSAMVREIAAEMDWDLHGLIGHRLHVRYPLWGAAHVIGLDFDVARSDSRADEPPNRSTTD